MTDQNNSVKNPPNSVKDQAAFMSFIDDVLKEKNAPAIKPEHLPQVKTLLLKELNEKVNTHLISLLSEKDQLELDDLLNKNISDEELDNFFQTKIPNLVPEMTSVLLEFRNTYLFTPVAKKSEETVEKAIQNKNEEDLLNPEPAPIGK